MRRVMLLCHTILLTWGILMEKALPTELGARIAHGCIRTRAPPCMAITGGNDILPSRVMCGVGGVPVGLLFMVLVLVPDTAIVASGSVTAGGVITVEVWGRINPLRVRGRNIFIACRRNDPDMLSSV
jgi:hypothetical protein